MEVGEHKRVIHEATNTHTKLYLFNIWHINFKLDFNSVSGYVDNINKLMLFVAVVNFSIESNVSGTYYCSIK